MTPTTTMIFAVAIASLSSTAFAQNRVYKADAGIRRFDDEPTVREVQLAALRYFKLDEATLDSLADNAGLKGLIPTLGLNGGFSTSDSGDESFNDEVNPFDGNDKLDQEIAWLANRAFGNSFSVSGNLSWNLPALAFNGESLAVMARAGNREGLLKSVTKTYFERRKAQIDLAMNPPEDEESRMLKDLKIEEHTAMLDALTGGWFSKQSRR